MQRVRVLLGLLAAIILMIGGTPASAASNACNPCPLDCPMMMQTAKPAADHHNQGPGKGGKAETPCKSMAVCQSVFAAPPPAQTAAEMSLHAEATEHDLVVALAAPSFSPDPALRPPIQL